MKTSSRDQSPVVPRDLYRRLKRRRKMQKETDIHLAAPRFAAVRNEICLKEKDTFVGATAGFDDKWDIILRRNDRVPEGYVLTP
jgi:hypothetical protein